MKAVALERGFNLIELTVVMAAFAILAAIAYPSYRHAVRKAKRTEGRAALMQLMQQEERYYAQFTSYIAFSSASANPEEKRFKWYSGGQSRTSAYEISGTACDGESIRDCVILTAVPGTARVDSSFDDKDCGRLILTSTGAESASGGASDCWE